MGGNNSRMRKLTVDNDDPSSIIRISEAVVQRIRSTQENEPLKEQKPIPPQSPVTATLLGQPSFLSYDSNSSTLQLKQSNLNELKKNDDYWQKRMKNLERNQKKINEIMDQEYQKAMDEMGVFKKENITVSRESPCQICKEAVRKCYLTYPNESMRCAKVVNEFQSCVDNRRSSLIAKRG